MSCEHLDFNECYECGVERRRVELRKRSLLLEEKMLQMVDLAPDVTRSDLQGIISSEARRLIEELAA